MAISHHPDVIVSETSLPGFDGFPGQNAAARHATGTSGIPFMFITADATPGNLARAQRSGADAVLTKPCRPAKLLDAVEVLAPRRADPRSIAGADAEGERPSRRVPGPALLGCVEPQDLPALRGR